MYDVSGGRALEGTPTKVELASERSDTPINSLAETRFIALDGMHRPTNICSLSGRVLHASLLISGVDHVYITDYPP